MSKLQIAIVGAGIIGKTHADLVMANSNCELAALVDPASETKKLAEQRRISYYPSLEGLLKKTRPDGIIIATPNQLHVEQALICIKNNVPVLIEKPVAHSLEEGYKLLEAATHANAKCLVGHHRAHSPIIATAKRVIVQNTLGKLVAVTGSAMFYKPDDYFALARWRTLQGAGPILINMIHEVGVLRYLCGDIIEVQAMASNAQRGYEVEDTAAINLRFSNGTIGSFILSDTAASARSWEQTSHENKSYANYPDEDCYVIAGTDGCLSIPSMKLKRYDSPAERSWWKPLNCSQIDLNKIDPLKLQLEHFCEMIVNNVEPIVSIHDALQNLKVIEAISQSVFTQSSILLSDNVA